jgi:hypothetical protein
MLCCFEEQGSRGGYKKITCIEGGVQEDLSIKVISTLKCKMDTQNLRYVYMHRSILYIKYVDLPLRVFQRSKALRFVALFPFQSVDWVRMQRRL